MAPLVPLLLVVIGGCLCAAGERAILDERWFKALVTALPGVALICMAVVVIVLGLAP